MAQPQQNGPPPNPNPVEQGQEVVMNFETLSAHGLACAISAKSVVQIKGLKLLAALIAEADESGKTHLGSIGAIPLFAKVMTQGIAPGPPPSLLKWRSGSIVYGRYTGG